jgi:nucleotide-binding universal stress UspA family protein
MRVLLAIDGSPSAQIATELVANLPWLPGAPVRIVRVVEPGPTAIDPALAIAIPAEPQAAVVRSALADLEAAARIVRERVLGVQTAVLNGRPPEEIVRDAREQGVDLIVVGDRGHSTFDRMLLGSTSAEVIDKSPVPVLVARRPTSARAIVAVDGSEIATNAVEVVSRWSLLRHTRCTVLSVVPMSPDWWLAIGASEPNPVQEHALAQARAASVADHVASAEAAVERLRNGGVAADWELRSGHAASEIVHGAVAADADLIVMGSHGRTGPARLLLGSVARNVLHHAPQSVLIIRRSPAGTRRRVPVEAPAGALAGAATA